MPKKPFNEEKLVERILTARPDAGIEDLRRLAPPLRERTDAEQENRLDRVRQRLGLGAKEK